MGRNANQVTLTFAGDSKDLQQSMDKVGQGAEQMGKRTGSAVDRLDQGFSRSQRSTQNYGRGLDRVGEGADQLDTRMMGLSDGIQGTTDLMRAGSLAPHEMAMAFADLGSAAYNTVIPSLKGVGDRLGGLRQRMATSLSATDGATRSMEGLGGSADTAGSRVQRMGSRIRGVGSRFGRLAAGVGGVTAALGVAGLAWQSYQDQQAKAEEQERAMADALAETEGRLSGGARDHVLEMLSTWEHFGVGANDAISALREGEDAWDRFVDNAAEGSSILRLMLEGLGDDYFKAQEALEAKADTTIGAAETARQYAQAEKDAAEAVEDHNSKLDSLLASTRELITERFSLQNAEIAIRDATRDLTEHVEEHGVQLGRTTEEGDRQFEMMQRLTEAEWGRIEALIQEGASEQELQAQMGRSQTSISETARRLGFSEEQTRQFIQAIQDVPAHRRTDIAATTSGISFAEARLNYLARNRHMNILPHVVTPSVVSGQGAAIAPQFRQHGGPVEAGRPYVVGEGGRPELFVPNLDGEILPSVPTPSPLPPMHHRGDDELRLTVDVMGADDEVARLIRRLLATGKLERV